MALVIDLSTPGVATNTNSAVATVSSGSFTPPAGSLLYIRWSWNTSNNLDHPAAPTITDSLGTHLTYTLLDHMSDATSPNVAGQCAHWWAQVGASAAMTVTVTGSVVGNSHGGALLVTVITGHDAVTPIGTHGKAGSASASTIAQALTGTRSGSWGFIGDTDWDLKGAQTAGTDCTLESSANVSTIITYGDVRRTIADGANGGSTTLNVTLPLTSVNLTWIYAEVLPALNISAGPYTGPTPAFTSPTAQPTPWPFGDTEAPTVGATDPLTLAWGAGGTYWLLYNTAALNVDRREVPQQRTYVSNPSLLGTALLENELLGGADTARHAGAAYYDRREVPQQRTYVSDPSMLATSLLEGALLGSADDIRRHYSATYYDRREVPNQRTYISDPSFYSAGAVTDPLTLAWGAGGTYWLLYNTAALDVDRREVPQQRTYVSNPSLLGTALLENELLGGADAARHTGAAYYDRREVPQQRQYVSDPLLLTTSLLEGVLLGSADDIRRHYGAAYYDRREVPNQRAYISDPSFYSTSAPTDPLTLAWGAGGTYWLLYNTAALDVDRREVPQQRAYVSNPSLLGTALLENELLGGADDYQRRHVGFSDRRVTVSQRVYLDLGPLLSDPLASSWGAGGTLWHRYNAAAYTDRREVPSQPSRWTTYVDILVAADPLMVAWGAGGNLWHRYNRRVPERDRWQVWLVPDIHSCTVFRPSTGTTAYVQVLTSRPGTGTTTRPSTGTTSRPNTGTTEEPC